MCDTSRFSSNANGYMAFQRPATHDSTHFVFGRDFVGELATRLQGKPADHARVYKNRLARICTHTNQDPSMWHMQA